MVTINLLCLMVTGIDVDSIQPALNNMKEFDRHIGKEDQCFIA
ncbi:hypothetical protein [Vibrio sp. SS-MA-C1-2]|nr:hypothetical protein [Vibrio sp. SS-MA-C1-2]